MICLGRHPEKHYGGQGWIRTSVLERTDLQSVAFNHSATYPCENEIIVGIDGAVKYFVDK